MRFFFWALAVLAIVLVVGGLALQFAIARNGPAVLDTVDRMTGGARGAKRLATLKTGEHPAQKLIIWGPKTRNPADPPLPVLVFVHGGSWRSGDPDDYGFVGRAFVPEGFIVALVGYRLMPDGAYPAMLEDTAKAIALLDATVSDYGGDPSRTVIAGHSAGAYNVVMTALERQWLERKGASNDSLRGVIGLSGPYDFYPFDSDSTKAAFGLAPDPEATQPLNHIRADAPPMLLIHGERDELVGLRNSRALTLALTEAGAQARLVTYPEMAHNDPLIALAEPWRSRRDLVATMSKFAREVTR